MIRNLTMGDITIYDGDKPSLRIQSEGDYNDDNEAIKGMAVVATVDGVPIVERIIGKVELPEPEENAFLIVTRAVADAAAAQGRTTSDLLLLPSWSDEAIVRDRDQRIVGCRQLERHSR